MNESIEGYAIECDGYGLWRLLLDGRGVTDWLSTADILVPLEGCPNVSWQNEYITE